MIKKALKVLCIVILLLVLIALGGYWYLSHHVLNFEDQYVLEEEIAQISSDGFAFLDRNANGVLDPYEDERLSVDDRVANVLSLMTVEEKIHILKGSGFASAIGKLSPEESIPGVVGTVPPTPRLGLPSIQLSDGPAGIRILPKRENEDKTYYCTAFPIASQLASTWNTDLVQSVGNAMGKEGLEYGIDVILAPGANLHRHPFCGRNFEYYSEDPVLSGKIGAAMVRGIQENGVGVSVKHYVANNQETNRNNNDTRVSEKALRELYLKGFEIIVKESNPWTIMSSYNKVNGIHVAEDPRLLTEVLREEWDFQGLVVSDWFGGKDPVAMVKAGNDLLEPGTKWQWKALLKAHEDGELPLEDINKAARRVLKLLFKTPRMNAYDYSNEPDLTRHARITRESATEGIVLLKNEARALPLPAKAKIALLGTTSFDFIAGGTGSGDVNEAYTVSLEQGLEKTGFDINPMSKALFENLKNENPEKFVKTEGLEAMLNPYVAPTMVYEEAQLLEMARDSDIGIYTIGRNSGEGGDRVEKNDFLLNEIEISNLELASSVFKKQGKKLVVVLNIGGVIETASWKHLADAIVLGWQGGQEGGNAVADVLSGKVNPSGKLPMTFPVRVSDHASHSNFPTQGGSFDPIAFLLGKEKPESEWVENIDFTSYEEELFVGYRHFDKEEIAPSFPFGFGQSYTDFKLDSIQVIREEKQIKLGVRVTNMGAFSGKEVVQVYVGIPDSGGSRPVKELKAFAKTKLISPREYQYLELVIPDTYLQYWNEDLNQWQKSQDAHTLSVGTSSRDIEWQTKF